MGKRNDLNLDLKEFEGPEGMKRLLKLAQEQLAGEADDKRNTGEDQDDSEDENEGPREGCSLAYDALNLKLVKKENDLNPLFCPEMLFKPEYVHSIYGQEEEIEGYEGLQINIFMLAGSLNTLVEFQYDKKLKGAPDFLKPLKENCLVEGFALKRKEFAAKIAEEKDFKPFGKKIKQYTVKKSQSTDKKSKEPSEEHYEIWAARTTESGENESKFNSYKRRLEAFVKLFIEVGSAVEESEHWEYLISYKVEQDGSYTFVGFVNRYEFNLSANKSRHRLSQILVIPPFQRQGHALQLLKCLYELAIEDPKCLELTVEDASENLQIARDILQTQMIVDGDYWPWVKAVKSKSIKSIFALSGLVISNEEEIKKKLKMPIHEIRRTYEILALSKIDPSAKDVNDRFKGMCLAYNKEQKEVRSLKRKMPYIIFEGTPLKVDLQSVLEQKKLLEPNDEFYMETFQVAKEQYLHVIEKLNL